MKDKLRIVHCFRSPLGGIFRHVRDLTEAQAAAGHSVGIVCDSTTGGAFEDALFEQISGNLVLGIHRTPMQRHIGIGDALAAWKTFRIIKELQPDVLHGHGAKGGAYARLFGSLLRVSGSRVARIYSPHGGSLHYDEETLAGKTLFALERAMGKLTDHLLFVSDHERRTYRHKVGAPHGPSSLVYNGLRAAEFAPVIVREDAADFLYIGMMRDLKGPDIFIDAFAAAEKLMGRPLTAVMVGDGEDLPKYREQVARLGLEERITFHQPMPARQAFELANLVIVPSRAEAMPYIVLETLAAGRPIIASAVGGIPEVLGTGSKALIAPKPDILAASIVSALSDPEACRRAMPDVVALRKVFNANVMAGRIEAAYTATLNGKDEIGRAGDQQDCTAG
ncbi:glycosyltransferase family 4 protein [Aquamicrobium lusatiense]|uniref:glycosyltransferase family 4 protein n=1 Tax=Aquamicrobium lusatiense TaxID=89772 RepID=UPI0016165032|nr:glycosyltransferase family 4 protein [Aquamicrobium lusatiense]